MTGKQRMWKLAHIKGLNKSGCEMVKEDKEYLYFNVPKDMDNEALSDVNNTLFEHTGLKLKVRRLLHALKKFIDNPKD